MEEMPRRQITQFMVTKFKSMKPPRKAFPLVVYIPKVISVDACVYFQPLFLSKTGGCDGSYNFKAFEYIAQRLF